VSANNAVSCLLTDSPECWALELDTLHPAERIVFVLHDMFAVPFDQIAPIVERTPVAVRPNWRWSTAQWESSWPRVADCCSRSPSPSRTILAGDRGLRNIHVRSCAKPSPG
jgi:hypothetical protein